MDDMKIEDICHLSNKKAFICTLVFICLFLKSKYQNSMLNTYIDMSVAMRLSRREHKLAIEALAQGGKGITSVCSSECKREWQPSLFWNSWKERDKAFDTNKFKNSYIR